MRTPLVRASVVAALIAAVTLNMSIAASAADQPPVYNPSPANPWEHHPRLQTTPVPGKTVPVKGLPPLAKGYKNKVACYPTEKACTDAWEGHKYSPISATRICQGTRNGCDIPADRYTPDTCIYQNSAGRQGPGPAKTWCWAHAFGMW